MFDGIRARRAQTKARKAESTRAAETATVAQLLANRQPPKRGTQQLAEAYKISPALRMVCGRIGYAVASTPFTLERAVTGKGGKVLHPYALQRASFEHRERMAATMRKAGNLEPVADENHPLLRLLSNGNPHLPGTTCIKIAQLHLDIHGEAFWIFERDGLGMPVEIWPAPPAWCVSIATPTEPFFLFRWQGRERRVPEADVVYFRDPDPANPYGRGTGIAEALGDELDTDEYASKFIKSFFYNDAIPAAVVSFDGADEKQVMAAEQRWLAKFRGHQNAHRVSFTNKKIDVKQLTQSFASNQMTQLREYERDIIIHTFGVPPEIFGILTNSNRATIDAADYLFARWVIVPRLDFIRSTLQHALVPMFDERAVLGFVSPIPDDREFWLKTAVANPAALSRGEWRESLGKDSHGPVDDVYVMTLGAIERPIRGSMPTPSAPATAPTQDAPQVETPDTPPPESTAPAKAKAVHKDKLRPGDVDAILEALRPERLTVDIDKLFRDEIEKWGSDALAELGVDPSFSMLNPLVTQHLEKLSLEHLGGFVQETTKQELRDALTEGVQAGESSRELAGRVAEVFDGADSWRATNIARTEVLGSSNFATFTAYGQSGIVDGKQWVDTPDDRTRDTHRELGAQPPIPLNDPFVVDGKMAMHPGDFGDPAEDCMCRCTTTAVVGGEPKSAEARAAIWKAYDRKLVPWEDKTIAALRKGFSGQRNDIIAALQRLA